MDFEQFVQQVVDSAPTLTDDKKQTLVSIFAPAAAQSF